jgi:hypothetical protein
VFAADALRRARLEANGGYTLEARKVLERRSNASRMTTTRCGCSARLYVAAQVPRRD